MNTLGAFENGSLFAAIQNWQAVIALVYSHASAGGNPEDSSKIGELLKLEEKKEGCISAHYDDQNAQIHQIFAGLLNKVSSCMSVLAGLQKEDPSTEA